jgi:hypothetical protein
MASSLDAGADARWPPVRRAFRRRFASANSLSRAASDRWCDGSVLVAIDPLADPASALRLGISLARQQRTRLAILALTRDPPSWVFQTAIASPWCWHSLRAENVDRATRACSTLVDCLPGDIPTTFAVACGRAERVLTPILTNGGASKLVLPRHWIVRRRTSDWARLGIDLYLA